MSITAPSLLNIGPKADASHHTYYTINSIKHVFLSPLTILSCTRGDKLWIRPQRFSFFDTTIESL